MIRFAAATAVFALGLTSGPITPALAKQIHNHPSGKDMAGYSAGHTTPGARTGFGVSEPTPLSPTARDAECAILWQSALHGEIE